MRAEYHKDDLEWKAYMDLFEFHKQYGVPEPKNDAYWSGMIEAANGLNIKYTGTRMAGVVNRHLIALMGLFNGEAKEQVARS